MEHFKNYIELQGLIKKIESHKENIKSFENRLNFINTEREKRSQYKSEIETNKSLTTQMIKDLEKSLFDSERSLKRAHENLAQAASASQMKTIEADILRLTSLIDETEESILEKLDEQEGHDSLINEADEFLKGSLETYTEIKEEVKVDCEKELREIANYNTRIELILSSLDSERRDFFNSVLANVKDKQVISFLDGKSCSRCHYEAASVQITEIENGRSNEVCNNCSRILIPKTINSF